MTFIICIRDKVTQNVLASQEEKMVLCLTWTILFGTVLSYMFTFRSKVKNTDMVRMEMPSKYFKENITLLFAPNYEKNSRIAKVQAGHVYKQRGRKGKESPLVRF